MKILNFTIIKLTSCLVIGILIGHLHNITILQAIYLLSVFLILLSISYVISKRHFLKTIWFGVLAYCTMACIGVFTVTIHNQKNNPSHYSNVIPFDIDSTKTITYRVREVLKPGNYYDKYIIDILSINDMNVSGKTILNIQKDSLNKPLHVDDIYITKSLFKEVIPPLNPGQFNYKNYLEKQYIYHQIFTTSNALFKVNTKKQTLLGIANKVREHINYKLKMFSFKPNELAIINALFLGQRQNISEDVYTNYANAGAIHILAISGLHIGIILIILSSIFKPLEQLRHGRYIKIILLVIILWGFAIIAGLSASVTRAVTMFSIVTIGMHLKRSTNIYNTLAISIFILLLIKPLFLFDVGFQLSYLAVFGIVSIDPYLYNLWKPKYRIAKIYWHTLTVTMSAQFGIIPISLYYFHQFPGLFFLSNLLIIPILGFLLGLGILIILLAILNILPLFLANLFGTIISFMNDIIAWIANQETFLFKDISFDFLYMIASYLLIISFFRFSIKRNYKTLIFLLLTIIIGQSVFIHNKLQSAKNQFLVFHKSQHSLFVNRLKNKIIVTHDFDSTATKNDKIISDFTINNHIKIIKRDTFKNLYTLGNKRLFVIDSLGAYNIKSFKPDVVLLRNSPKINLNRLIETLQPSLIIADGSNYKTYIERWKATCNKTKIPFHQTSEKGAFIIDY